MKGWDRVVTFANLLNSLVTVHYDRLLSVSLLDKSSPSNSSRMHSDGMNGGDAQVELFISS